MHAGTPLTEATKYTSLKHEDAKATTVLQVHPQQLLESGQPAGATCMVSISGMSCVLQHAVCCISVVPPLLIYRSQPAQYKA